MKHLTEDELVELYYGEGTSAANAHLGACRECSRNAEILAKPKGDSAGGGSSAARGLRRRVWQTPIAADPV